MFHLLTESTKFFKNGNQLVLKRIIEETNLSFQFFVLLKHKKLEI